MDLEIAMKALDGDLKDKMTEKTTLLSKNKNSFDLFNLTWSVLFIKLVGDNNETLNDVYVFSVSLLLKAWAVCSDIYRQ